MSCTFLRSEDMVPVLMKLHETSFQSRSICYMKTVTVRETKVKSKIKKEHKGGYKCLTITLLCIPENTYIYGT